MSKIPIYGLTGNMGCGKTTVAKFFDEFEDVVVFSADEIAKEMLCGKKNSKSLMKLFGPKIFSGGKIDLRKVANLVFNNFEALEKLEKFVHPLTWQAIRKKIKEYNGISFFLIEAALIYESGYDEFLNGVVVVACEETEQYHRLLKRGDLPPKEIAKRLARQLPSKQKVKQADFVIDTGCLLKEVKNKVQDLYYRLRKKIAVYPGTFDPITLGHLDVIRKSAAVFDEVIVGILTNPQKKPMFVKEKRLAMIKESIKDAGFTNVRITTFKGLTVEFARQEKAIAIIRGLRLTTEYEAELDMCFNNDILAGKNPIYTILIPPTQEHVNIRSTTVRELLAFGKKDLGRYVPKAVLKRLK